MENRKSCRRSMLLHKKFLFSLFSANGINAKLIIQAAKSKEIKLVLKVLHFIASGSIPVKTDVYDKLVATRKLKYMKQIETKGGLQSRLKDGPAVQQAYLLHFAAIYPQLLKPLFEE